jgi:hypothetical protein
MTINEMISIAILTAGFIFGGVLYVWWHSRKDK